MKLIFRNIAILLLFSATACHGQSQKSVATVQKFTVPKPPAMLTAQEARAEFVATHYWDNFNFADTTLIGNADITEQAFADFVNILPHLPESLIEKSVAAMMRKATADNAMYAHFMELSEKYLYEPNSPMRNEDLYIVVLHNILANGKLDNIYKVRPRYQLELALKNRVGNKALDFAYTTEKGGKAKLYATAGDPLLLFFFRPDCAMCKEVKEYVGSRGIDKQVKILYVNPETDTHLGTLYDLRASPTLYLLAKDKTVILKDVSIEQIEQHLTK